MEYTMDRDPLTGLFSRKGLQAAGMLEVEKACRTNRPVTAIYVDVDDFKNFNLRYGESAGDKLLVLLATTLAKIFRKTDIICRLHDDEFVILLNNTGAEEAMQLLHRLQSTLEQTIGRTGLTLTASVGAVTYMTCPASIDTVIKKVESLLHGVKRAGTNTRVHEVVEAASSVDGGCLIS